MLWTVNVLVAALLCLIAFAFAVRRMVKGRADAIPIGSLALAAAALVIAPWITMELGREGHIRAHQQLKAEVEAIVPALDAYHVSHGQYPESLEELGVAQPEGTEYSSFDEGERCHFLLVDDPLTILPLRWSSATRIWDD